MITRLDSQKSFFLFVKDTNTGVVKRIAIPADTQIGLVNTPAFFEMHGGVSMNTRTCSATGVNLGVFDLSGHDTLVTVLNESIESGSINVNLPVAPRDGQLHFIKDGSGTASSINININPTTGSFIDGSAIKTLDNDYDSMALYWSEGSWRVLIAGSGGIIASGSVTDASYITVNSESGLSNERQFAASSNISISDGGPGSTFSTDLTDTGVSAGSYTNPSITVDAKGRVTSISTTSPSAAPFVTISNDATLTNERAISGSVGIKLIDHGANSTLEVKVNDNDVATLTGSTFSGPVIAGGGLSGSLQKLSSGASYLVAQGNISITSQSNGQVVVSSSVGTPIAGTGIRVSNTTVSIDDNVVATVSGTTFSGPVTAILAGLTGSITGTQGRFNKLSGSLTQLESGLSYLVAGGGISISSQSSGQVVVSTTGGGTTSGFLDGTNKLKTTASVAISGQENVYVDSKGTDVFFYVSGTTGLTGSTAKKAVLGGDVQISGTLTVGSGSVSITSNDIQFGTFGTRLEKQGSDLKFFDANNPSGFTLTQLGSSTGGSGGGSSSGGSSNVVTGSVWPITHSMATQLSGAGSPSMGSAAVENDGTAFFVLSTQKILGTRLWFSSSTTRPLEVYLWGPSSNRILREKTSLGPGEGLFFVPFTTATYTIAADAKARSELGATFTISVNMLDSGTRPRVTSATTPALPYMATPDYCIISNRKFGSGDGFPGSNAGTEWYPIEPVFQDKQVFLTGSVATNTSGSIWQTAFDIDLTTQTSASFTTDGEHSLAGYSWTFQNMANADSIGILPGVGLIIDPNANASNLFETVFTSPAISLPISRSVPGFNIRDYELRLWVQVEVTGSDANSEVVKSCFAKYPLATGGTKYAVSTNKGFTTAGFTNIEAIVNSVASTGTSGSANNNYFMMHWFETLDVAFHFASGSSPTLTFDQASSSLVLAGNYKGSAGITNASSHGISGSGDLAITLAAMTANTNNSFQATYRRIRLEYRHN